MGVSGRGARAGRAGASLRQWRAMPRASRRSASAREGPLAPLRPTCAALDAVASMPQATWQPVEVKPVLCITGGLSAEPIPLLETTEAPTHDGKKRELFVHFALYLPWVFTVTAGAQCRGSATGRKSHKTGRLSGQVWKDLVNAFQTAARGEGGEQATDDDDGGDDDDPMNALLAPLDLHGPEGPKDPEPRTKKAKVMGRAIPVSAKEKCPLAFPGDKEERQVQMISLKKNQYWIAASDLGWLCERLRSENELAGVPLVENPDEDRAAVAAPVSGTDSQESVPSTSSVDSPQASSAQGTVDCGYTCKWNFPSRDDAGSWEATITREGELLGKKVSCALKDFNKTKWNQVYGEGTKEPCKFARATVSHKKTACKLYLDQRMADVLSA